MEKSNQNADEATVSTNVVGNNSDSDSDSDFFEFQSVRPAKIETPIVDIEDNKANVINASN